MTLAKDDERAVTTIAGRRDFSIAAQPNTLPPVPEERWVAAKGESPPDFIKRVWKEWIDQGVLTRSHLLRYDRPLYIAWSRWIAANDHVMPEGLNLPRVSERMAAQMEAIGLTDDKPRPSPSDIKDKKEFRRLYMAAWRRRID